MSLTEGTFRKVKFHNFLLRFSDYYNTFPLALLEIDNLTETFYRIELDSFALQ